MTSKPAPKPSATVASKTTREYELEKTAHFRLAIQVGEFLRQFANYDMVRDKQSFHGQETFTSYTMDYHISDYPKKYRIYHTITVDTRVKEISDE